jgi:hypothetical protein
MSETAFEARFPYLHTPRFTHRWAMAATDFGLEFGQGRYSAIEYDLTNLIRRAQLNNV